MNGRMRDLVNGDGDPYAQSKTLISKQIIFGFIGQGYQYTNMTYDIYKRLPLFREIVNHCLQNTHKTVKIDLEDFLLKVKSPKKTQEKPLKTEYTQLILFIIEYSFAKLLILLGVKPTSMIGHGLGEYVAAAIANAFSLEDAFKLIVARSRLIAKTKPGVMLAIPMSNTDILPLITDEVDISIQSAPNLTIISGNKSHIDKFITKIKPILKKENLNYQYLHTSHASHAQYIEPILNEFLDAVADIQFNTPVIPFVSNSSGSWIDSSSIHNKKYWLEHLRNTALFPEKIANLTLTSDDIFIEMSPGGILCQLILRHENFKPQALNAMPNFINISDNSYEMFLSIVNKLHLLGIDIDWDKLYADCSSEDASQISNKSH